MKKMTVLAILLTLVAAAIHAQDEPKKNEMECRDLAEANNMVGPDETLVDGKVCKKVPKATALNTRATTPQQTPVAQPKPCLIVTSAEGHRFRNSMIAGALTGGVGLAAGMAFSGGRYEYRDSYGLAQSDVKLKYKGPQLQKLEQTGVHVIVVNKKDKSGGEVKDARAACHAAD
jgi:hypothetical protein